MASRRKLPWSKRSQTTKFNPFGDDEGEIACPEIEHTLDFLGLSVPSLITEGSILGRLRPLQVIALMQRSDRFEQIVPQSSDSTGAITNAGLSQPPPRWSELSPHGQGVCSNSSSLFEPQDRVHSSSTAHEQVSDQDAALVIALEAFRMEGFSPIPRERTPLRVSGSACFHPTPTNSSRNEPVFSRPPDGWQDRSSGSMENYADYAERSVFSRPVFVPPPTRLGTSNLGTSNPSPKPAPPRHAGDDASNRGEEQPKGHQREDKQAEEEESEEVTESSIVEDEDSDDDYPCIFNFSNAVADDDYFPSSDESEYEVDGYVADDEDTMATADSRGCPSVLSILSAYSSAESLTYTTSTSSADPSVWTGSDSEMEPEVGVVHAENLQLYRRRELAVRRLTLG